MTTRIRKSRTFAVVLTPGNTLGAYFLTLKTYEDDRKDLDYRAYETKWSASEKDKLIELLVEAGLSVRFHQDDEKQWMDNSLQYGYIPAPGDRTGQWSFPSIEEFERDYLAIM